ncbi:MAG: hypothetical protein QG646_3685 [Euryarchaeota archaeon]|nr:hypothetical protein [Euryarchaeota archaeon]
MIAGIIFPFKCLITMLSIFPGGYHIPKHQQTHQTKEPKSTFQKQALHAMQMPTSHPAAITRRDRINLKSLTQDDVLQLQRTIGNRAVGRLLTEIGLIPSKAKQIRPVQMKTMSEEEKEPLQGKFAKPLQQQEMSEEEESLQVKFENEPKQATCPSYSTFPTQREKENHTGMPDYLKASVENLSGIDMSDVSVYYNSDKPAAVGALAYTQRTDIHIAPGQEKHLPHEAWHVVQQAQGRVQPTLQLEDIFVNDDIGLETEADIMGQKSMQFFKTPQSIVNMRMSGNTKLIQRLTIAYTGEDLGVPPLPVAFPMQVIHQIIYQRAQIPGTVLALVAGHADNEPGHIMNKHYIPHMRIIDNLINMLQGQPRTAIVAQVNGILVALGIAPPPGLFPLTFRAQFDAWLNEAFVSIADNHNIIFRGPSGGDHNGTTLDVPGGGVNSAAQILRMAPFLANYRAQGLWL